MNRYEDQPADVLLRDLFDLGRKTTWTVDDQIEYDEDVAAIKIAVIREASVGVIAVPRYGDGEITIDIDEADYVPSTDDSIEGHHRAIIESIKKKVPEGRYYLISKETKHE